MERRNFEVKVGDHDLVLKLGNCACVLFRSHQEMDYLAVDLEDDQVLRVFNNADFVRWIAGYAVVEQDGVLHRPTTRNSDMENCTFRELHGWNPPTIEKEEPNEQEMDMFVEINTDDLDGEREW